MFRRCFLQVGLCCGLGIFSALSGAVEASEPVVLTIELPKVGDQAARVVEFTLADLSALPATEFSTTTNWTSGMQRFTGLMLRDLLDHLDVMPSHLELKAFNDYSVGLDVSDPTFDGALLAYRRNDQVMPTRDKGPLWVVYHYDSDAAFRTEVVYSNSIWQLDRIVISR